MPVWISLLLGGIFCLGLVPLLGGGVALGQAVRLRLRRRAGGVRRGLVSLEGTASAADGLGTVTSPDGVDCLAYRREVARDEGRRARPDWRTVATERDGRPFVLEWPAGRAVVDPEGARLSVDPADERVVENATAGRDPAGVDAADDARYRVGERRIEAGQAVGVTAVATDRRVDVGGESLPVVAFPGEAGPVSRVLGVPHALYPRGDDRVGRRLRDRALAGLVLGLPPVMLAVVFAFPPGT